MDQQHSFTTHPPAAEGEPSASIVPSRDVTVPVTGIVPSTTVQGLPDWDLVPPATVLTRRRRSGP
jgi:hypothetical protein